MRNIKYLLAIIFLLFSMYTKAQYCTSDSRFTEIQYFDNSEIITITDVVYGTANDWEGNPQDLLMDVWYPSGANETLSERPFILLIHGGGFTSGNKNFMSLECRRFAQKGYVAATINYRLGWDGNDPFGVILAAYRAQQDAMAALRYIVDNANTYEIDTNWVFIGGVSAGAITSLNTIFINETEWESVFPSIISDWGNLNTSGNSLTNTFDIKAVYNDCGMAFDVGINPADMVPIISFHGYLDNIVPIGTADGTIGSAVIHDLLLANGVCSELTVDSLGGHCPHPGDFRVERAACFFKNIFCNTCTSNYFTEEIPANCSTNTGGDFKVQLNLFLEGPYDAATGLMRTDLQANGLVPTMQPFSAMPWNYQGTESLANSADFPADMVDWVLVELRDATNNFSIIEQKAALLLTDGCIVDINATVGVTFPTLATTANYYVSVKARNHLAIMSSSAISLPNTTPFHLSNSNNVLGGPSQLTQVNTGIYAMAAGDFDGNGFVTVADFNRYITQVSSVNMYAYGDATTDGNVTVADFNIYRPNASKIGIAQIRY